MIWRARGACVREGKRERDTRQKLVYKFGDLKRSPAGLLDPHSVALNLPSSTWLLLSTGDGDALLAPAPPAAARSCCAAIDATFAAGTGVGTSA